MLTSSIVNYCMVLWVLRYEKFIPGVMFTFKHNGNHKNWTIVDIFEQIKVMPLHKTSSFLHSIGVKY